jgi:MOSC domain-containing protein YiiM
MLSVGELTPGRGLQGDNWGDSRTAEATPPDAESSNQISLMSSRVIEELAVTEDRWPLAGDNLYVDFDLSTENLPPGSRIVVGTALLEITGEPHTGCKKFLRRFGKDAVDFVNSAEGKKLNLRGIFARVLQAGIVRVGDAIKKPA